jgi:amino acid adenylation domain-containing protein/non-ribosomal peptide synthase protein (TIGR01720 family)
MNHLQQKIAELPEKKRLLLETLLKEKGFDLTAKMILSQGRENNQFPLSFAQQRLWFLDQLLPDNPYYNIPMAIELSGNIDIDIFRKSFAALIMRHEALRTTFEHEGLDPVQIIHPDMPLEIPFVDLSGNAQFEKERMVQREAFIEASQAFDLSRGPLFRVKILRLAPEKHVLLLTMHHIITDGWSNEVMISEMAQLYSAYQANQPLHLPELPVQYADFAVWQREWMQGEILQKQLNYWKSELGNDSMILDLPTDYPRPAVFDQQGAVYKFTLPQEVLEPLKALAKQEGVTLFILLLAIYQILLYRYTHQNQINVGTAIANRERPEVQHMMGFFVNMLVLKAAFSEDLSFRELLQQVKETFLKAQAHQDLPFEMLVDAIQPQRDMSHTPLFQTVFTLQNEPRTSFQLSGLTWKLLTTSSGTSKFDFTWTIFEDRKHFGGMVEYCVKLYKEETIAQMVDHFIVLLHSVLDNPNELISKFELLSELDREKQLFDLNRTEKRFEGEQTLHKAFSRQSARTPLQPALYFNGQTMTYQTLDERTNQLARFLIKEGVTPDTPVGLYFERSFDMIVAIMGVLKAGGAYVPMSPIYPKDRLAFIQEDAEMPVVLTCSDLAGRLETLNGRVVQLDKDWETKISGEEKTFPDVPVRADHLAYIIYTSGSTGKPKGVLVEHGNILNTIYAYQDVFHLGSRSRVLQFFHYTFDGSVIDIFLALLTGATLCLPESDLTHSGEQLADFMQEAKVTWATLTPTGLSLLPYRELPDLEVVLTGGEATNWDLVRLWGRQYQFWNVYGPTECAVVSTWCRLDNHPDKSGVVPIGKPIANMKHYILDQQKQLVPVGVIGELYISGMGISRGYLNRPELTKDRFIDNPFDDGHERLYRTGDRVLYDRNGLIKFLGRFDHQVKIRGYRIEIGEIESALKSHEQIKDAVVVVRDSTTIGKYLAAYLISENAAKESSQSIKDYLRDTLPDYMVPTMMTYVDAYPQNTSGKVDRKALVAFEGEQPDISNTYVAPTTTAEKYLASLIAELLELQKVGVNDNFFELGGHSILATQLVSRVRNDLSIDLKVREVFDQPVISELARRIESYQFEGKQQKKVSINPIRRDGDIPLSFAQQRMWFLDQLEPGSYLYHIPDVFRVEGNLDLKAFERSIDQIVERHEILRTGFSTIDGKASQVIVGELETPLRYVNLVNATKADQDAFLAEAIPEVIKRPFDLSKPPLFRITIIKLSEQNFMIVFVMHHIISDGWSMTIFIKELWEFYNAIKEENKTASLPEMVIQYADFAAWQRELLTGFLLDEQINYWKIQLEGAADRINLPVDHPRPKIQSNAGGHFPFSISQEKMKALQDLSHRYGVSLFMTLLAAFQILLYRYSGQEDVSIGTPIANRNHKALEPLIGFFVNTLVIRGDLSGSPTFEEVLQRVKNTTLDAYAHQDVPFEMLVDALAPERNMGQTPLFQVMFVLQNLPRAAMEFPGLKWTQADYEFDISTFDLSIILNESPTGLKGGLEYSKDLFEQATIQRMSEHYLRLLDRIIADPKMKIPSLELLSLEEKHQITIEWNNTSKPIPEDLCVHHLFEMRAQAMPDKVAVRMPVFEGRSPKQLTYRELNDAANQLAHHLDSLGVGPETLVGLSIDRSLEMLIGMLGILKAGGAYVPLDPTYPKERLQYMIEDSGLRFLVTQPEIFDRLPTMDGDWVVIDRDWDKISQYPKTNPELAVKSHHLAYVIYTSGSTGKPKGVMVQHSGIVNHNLSMIEICDLQANDRVLQFSTINFDAAVEEIFPTLAVGASLILRPGKLLMEAKSFIQLIEDEGITVLDLPTAYWHEWVSEMQMMRLSIPEPLRLVIVGGEKAASDKLSTWQQLPGSLEVDWINTYGPTEASIISTYYPVKGKSPLWDPQREIPIGRPIANTSIYILDQAQKVVPMGVSGELVIGGFGIARGYLNQPELTGESFIADPIHPHSKQRVYRTGDLARYLPDGNIEFLGRVDHQVKLRGFRIELSGIEAVIGQMAQIKETVAMVREDQPGVKRLVAYIVGDETTEDLIQMVNQHARNNLPDYMVPAAVVVMDQLPKQPNGKIDRKALPIPEVAEINGEKIHVVPHSRPEEILAEIFRQTLMLKDVSIHDNIFTLGVDSIIGIQIIAKANQAGLNLTPKDLFESPTISGLAKASLQNKPITAEQGIVTGAVPLTPIQSWFLESERQNYHHWNQSILLQVNQTLDLDRLRQTTQLLAEHHDALRTRFEKSSSGWRQQISENIADTSFVVEKGKQAYVELSHSINEHQASLNITKGPIFKVVYFNRGGAPADRILIIAHHLVMDGVSWRILLEDFQSIYTQLTEKANAVLPLKTTSYKTWAEHLKDYATNSITESEAAYWTQFTQEKSIRLPLDFTKEMNTEESAQMITVQLDVEETNKLLKDAIKFFKVEINDLLLTALGEAVSCWTGNSSLLVGLESHGRTALFEDVDITRTVGWFTSQYPVILEIDRNKSLDQKISSVRTVLQQVPQDGIGFGLLKYMKRGKRLDDLIHEDQLDLIFNYLGRFDQSQMGQQIIEMASEHKGIERDLTQIRSHLLEVNGGVLDGQLQMVFTYSRHLHNRETIQQVANTFIDTLKRMIQASCQNDGEAFVPEDFPLAKLNQKRLDKVLSKINQMKERMES